MDISIDDMKRELRTLYRRLDMLNTRANWRMQDELANAAERKARRQVKLTAVQIAVLECRCGGLYE